MDIMDIIDVIDSAGFYSLEVWGGATFDVCMRFLRENPWERLRQIKARAKKTPLQMLLRGQNVVGYRHYPDDVLDRFVALACENGIDIFRIFDALNDTRNLEKAIMAVKKYGGHAQGTICYTISPVHTVEEYVRIAKREVEMGIDSICIKDMAGILSPISAEKLISALTQNVPVPVQMHCHATSGMATATYVEGVRAGAGAIDCAISSMSSFSSQPPVETMISIFNETSYHANIDVDALRKICKYFTKLAPQRKQGHCSSNPIDPDILVHHIPGGMISNLKSQLQQQNALDKLDLVLEELPKVRADFGYPPLVTPTSQIVGVQSVMNVLSGERYSLVPQETKDYIKGLYGRSPAPIKPEVQKKILGNEKVVSCRPADLLEPMLPNATKDIDAGLIKNEEDIISFCIFPEVSLDYFKWRNTPEDKRDPIPADKEQQSQTAAAQQESITYPSKPFLSPEDYKQLHALIENASALDISQIVIRKGDLNLNLETSEAGGEVAAQEHAAPAPKKKVKKDKPAKEEGPCVEAPLNGTFYTAASPGADPFVAVGDTVNEGDPVCIVEAMKLFNQITAPYKCKIVKFLAEHGQPVQKGQSLIAIEKL